VYQQTKESIPVLHGSPTAYRTAFGVKVKSPNKARLKPNKRNPPSPEYQLYMAQLHLA
jgi:hypothetical protein